MERQTQIVYPYTCTYGYICVSAETINTGTGWYIKWFCFA